MGVLSPRKRNSMSPGDLTLLARKKKEMKLKVSAHPNFDAMKALFNKLVTLCQLEVLGVAEVGERVKMLAFWLKVCEKLDEYNNLSALYAIRTGLCASPIHRLKETWAALPKKSKEMKERIDEIFKLGNGQKNLRDRMAIISQPAIPVLSIFLGDIVFIHDGNKTFEDEGELGVQEMRESEERRVNWLKMKLLAGRIQWIAMFQQCPFVFERVDVIQMYLERALQSAAVDEEVLYRLSRGIRPPVAKTKK